MTEEGLDFDPEVGYYREYRSVMSMEEVRAFYDLFTEWQVDERHGTYPRPIACDLQTQRGVAVTMTLLA